MTPWLLAFARIRALEVAAATSDGEQGVVVRTLRSLKGHVGTGEARENTAEARGC